MDRGARAGGVMLAAARAEPADCRIAPFADAARIVIKLGSSLLVGEDGAPRRAWLAGLVGEVAAMHAGGRQVVLVSSGAIALGSRRLGLARGGRASLEDAQAAASVGQIALAGLYAELFAAHGIVAAQLLLTADDLEDRRRHMNAAATLDRLLGLGAVPVVNENDSVATGEIRFGDNDRLAARVALACGAGALVLLSEVAGLFTADPARDPAARLIETVDDAGAIEADTRGGSSMGTGGMTAKLVAARIATRGGCAVAVADGRGERPLSRLLETGVGTVFPASGSAGGRKAWLLGRAGVNGRLVVDAGAAAALRGGASLLAAGVVRVEGAFARGDVIEVAGPGGVIARGLAAYDAEEVRAVAGHRNDAHAAILGQPPRSAVIHRDHLVLA